MDNKNVPPRADEKTKVISSNQINAVKPVVSNTVTAPAQPPQKTIKPTSPLSNGTGKSKRTILAGAVGGGLLLGLIGLTSFKSKDGSEESEAGGTGSGPIDAPLEEGQVVSINTGHEVYTGLNDELDLEAARSIASEHVGKEGLFMYKGELHPAMNNDEWNAQTVEEKLAYIEQINVIPPGPDDVITLPVEINGEIKDLQLDPLHVSDRIHIGNDDSGHVFLVPQGRSPIHLENISPGENGSYYRTDPETFEVSVFTIEEVFKQLDETGKAEVEVRIPGVDLGEQPLTYDFEIPESLLYYGTESVMDPKTDEELINERILEMAKEGGIDDIRKIKKHQNEDGSWDIKIKGDDGEKIKTTITLDELRSESEETVMGSVETENAADGENGEVFDGLVLPDNSDFSDSELTGYNDDVQIGNDDIQDYSSGHLPHNDHI